MKNKALTTLLIGILVLSCLSFTLAKDVSCPTCRGSGQADCLTCSGTGEIEQATSVICENCTGTGLLTPRVYLTGGLTAEVREDATYVTATFFNKENFAVDAKINATLSGYNVISDTVTFPPSKELTKEIKIDYVGVFQSKFQLYQALKLRVTGLEEITCPYCNGEGNALTTKTCTECSGTGKIVCPDCLGTGYVAEGYVAGSRTGLDLAFIGGVGVAAAVAVGGGFAGFFLLKKRRVSENSLRRLSSAEFQAWVLRRLDGRPPTSADTALGIDGYTSLNLPIQIKQSDSVGMNAVDLFASSVARRKASGGVIVAFEFSDDAIRGKVRARRNYNLDLQMLTVRELIENRKPY